MSGSPKKVRMTAKISRTVPCSLEVKERHAHGSSLRGSASVNPETVVVHGTSCGVFTVTANTSLNEYSLRLAWVPPIRQGVGIGENGL